MISNVRLHRLCVNPQNRWVPVHNIYDGPSLEQATTHAVRGMPPYNKRLPWSSDPRGHDIHMGGVSFETALHYYNLARQATENMELNIAPGMRLDVTVKGKG